MAFVIEQRGKVLVRQRPQGVVNAHLWEFPNVEVKFKTRSPEKIAAALFGVPTSIRGSLRRIKHSITRYRMTLEPYFARPQKRLPVNVGVWVSRNRVKQLAFSSAHRKVLKMVDERGTFR